MRRRVKKSGAIALGLPALVPPPFPFKPFVLASGVFEVNRTLFFGTVGVARLTRYSVEAVLAHHYGRAIVAWMQSVVFRDIIWALVAIIAGGTGYSIYRLTSRSAVARRA